MGQVGSWVLWKQKSMRSSACPKRAQPLLEETDSFCIIKTTMTCALKKARQPQWETRGMGTSEQGLLYSRQRAAGGQHWTGPGGSRSREDTGVRGVGDRGCGPGLLSSGIGGTGRILTATVGLWLRSWGMAPAVEGRGGDAGAAGDWGADPGGDADLGDGAGLGHRLCARRPRKPCRRARGRAASFPSESRRLAPASSDRTPRSTSSEHRRRPGPGLAGEPGWRLRGPGSSSLPEEASASSSSGLSWCPASWSLIVAGASPCSGLTSRSQAGGADAVPWSPHWYGLGPWPAASTQKSALLSRLKSCCGKKAM